MIEKCWGLLDNTGKCKIKGKIKGGKVEYSGSYPIDILGELHWQGFLSNNYFKYVKGKAREHIANPTAYEKTMWQTARGNLPLVENENSIFMFSCWIEDKYKAREIANIIRKYALLDEYELEFNFKEGDNKEKAKVIKERKLCLTN